MTMYDDTERGGDRAEIMDCAREAEDAIRRLARITIHRPSMTPADIDVVLAQLAGAVAALPQAATQLSDMLEQAHDDFDLAMDTLTDADDPAIAIGTARLHLDAAHDQTAHISAIDRLGQDAETPRVLRRSLVIFPRTPVDTDPASHTDVSPAARAVSGQSGAVDTCLSRGRRRWVSRSREIRSSTSHACRPRQTS